MNLFKKKETEYTVEKIESFFFDAERHGIANNYWFRCSVEGAMKTRLEELSESIDRKIKQAVIENNNVWLEREKWGVDFDEEYWVYSIQPQWAGCSDYDPDLGYWTRATFTKNGWDRELDIVAVGPDVNKGRPDWIPELKAKS